MSEMNFVEIFVVEAQEGLDLWERTVLRYESGAQDKEDIGTLFRIAHNLKGSALTVGLESLGQFLHGVEEVLSALKAGRIERSEAIVTLLLDAQDCLADWVQRLAREPQFVSPQKETFAGRIRALLENEPSAAKTIQTNEHTDANSLDTTQNASDAPAAVKTNHSGSNKNQATKANEGAFLRVPLPRLDELLNLIGELVVDQAIMQNHRTARSTASQQALRTISQMGKTIQEVQSIAMSLRMMPLDGTFQKLQRTARTVATQLGKQVEVLLEGGEVELDKVIVERLSEPLVHMVRNAIDHGAEDPNERKQSNKPETATLRIQAKQREDEVIIVIEDDGRGLQAEKLIEKAKGLGVIALDAKLSAEEAFALIFEPGLSTKTTVTEISGRGVGMDVVATSIRELKGAIDVKSTPGKGTTFTLTLPLSLSIIKGLVVGVAGEKYVVPLTQLVETFDTKKVPTESVRGKGQMLNIRGEVVPFLSIGQILGHSHHEFSSAAKERKADDRTLGVIASCRGRKVGFSVNAILGQQSVVLKNLSRVCDGLPGIIGGAILGDGQPALVLNLTDFGNTWSVKNAASS